MGHRPAQPVVGFLSEGTMGTTYSKDRQERRRRGGEVSGTGKSEAPTSAMATREGAESPCGLGRFRRASDMGCGPRLHNDGRKLQCSGDSILKIFMFFFSTFYRKQKDLIALTIFY